MHWKEFSVADIPLLLDFCRSKSWSDTVDSLASTIGHDHMDDALKHENIWTRRVAILHQLGRRDKVDTERLFQ